MNKMKDVSKSLHKSVVEVVISSSTHDFLHSL